LPYVHRPSLNNPFEARALTQDSLREDVLRLADGMQEQPAQPKIQYHSQESIIGSSNRNKKKNQNQGELIDERLFE
jgi:hypothetical protein